MHSEKSRNQALTTCKSRFIRTTFEDITSICHQNKGSSLTLIALVLFSQDLRLQEYVLHNLPTVSIFNV